MQNKEPTQEQAKEFWEWCGFVGVRHNDMPYTTKYLVHNGQKFHKCPPIDLSNLFKYAVPRVPKFSSVELYQELGLWEAVVWVNCKKTHQDTSVTYKELFKGKDEDPAIALFWALWAVIKEAK